MFIDRVDNPIEPLESDLLTKASIFLSVGGILVVGVLSQVFDWVDFYRDAKEDIPLNMPEPRGREVGIHCFLYASHAADKATRRSQSGILIFINRAPITFFSKKQNSVETSTFGSEFTACKQAVELVKGLRYKLRMFGIPIEGPASLYCDNEAVYKNVGIPTSVLNKKMHGISYHFCREAVASGTCRIAKSRRTSVEIWKTPHTRY